MLLASPLALPLPPLPSPVFPTPPWVLTTAARWSSHLWPSPPQSFLLPFGSPLIQKVLILLSECVFFNVPASRLTLFGQLSEAYLRRCIRLNLLHFYSVTGASSHP